MCLGLTLVQSLLDMRVSLEDDFDYNISPRFEAPIDTHVTNVREKINLPISSLYDTPFVTNNPKDVINDLLIKPDPPIPVARLYEIEEGAESKDNVSTKLDVGSSNLESADPISRRFIELALPNL